MTRRSHYPAVISGSDDQHDRVGAADRDTADRRGESTTRGDRRRRTAPGMGVGETIAFVVGLVAIVVVVVAFL